MRTRVSAGLLILSCAILLSCTASSGDDAGNPNGTDAGGTPRVRVGLSANKTTLMSGESASFTATVTPSAGAAVANGTLLQGTLSVGTFVKQSDGTFAIAASWAQLVSADLKGVMNQPLSVTVTARFNDDLGNSGEGTTTISLGCPASKGLCGGSCKFMFSDPNNCAGCGNDCTRPLDGPGPGQTTSNPGCSFGLCGTQIVDYVPGQVSCTSQCATQWKYNGQPMHCVPGCDPQASTDFPSPPSPFAGKAYYGTDSSTLMKLFVQLNACDDVPPATYMGRNLVDVACCCAASF